MGVGVMGTATPCFTGKAPGDVARSLGTALGEVLKLVAVAGHVPLPRSGDRTVVPPGPANDSVRSRRPAHADGPHTLCRPPQ